MKEILAACIFVPLFLFSLTMEIYGLVLAFSASFWLGVASLFIEPSPFIFGLAKFFGGVDLPAKIMLALN